MAEIDAVRHRGGDTPEAPALVERRGAAEEPALHV